MVIKRGVKMSEQKREPKPFNYPDFSKMDPNDPLLKVLEERRPYSSGDFKDRPRNYMIPDLRWTFGNKQYGG